MLLTLLMLLSLLLASGMAHAQTVRITGALSAESDAAFFPEGAEVRQVTLPDEWADSRPGATGPIWYRVGFTASNAPGRTDLLALYIQRACTNLEVHVNGQLVHSGGRMRGVVTHNCNHPQLVSLPAALIVAGQNVLDIKVVGVPLARVASRQRAGTLSALEIGPLEPLQARHQRQTVLQVGIPQAVSATLALMGGFMIVLAWVNRRESHLAYFGAMSVGWAVFGSRLWLRDLPVSNDRTEFLLVALLPLIAAAAVQFLLRYAGVRERLVAQALALQCVLVPLTLWWIGPEGLNPAARFWYTLLGVQVIAAGAVYLRSQWVGQRAGFWWMASLLGTVAVAVLIEFIGLRTLLDSDAALFAQTVVPVTLVLVGLRLIQQHGRALQTSEENRASLELRIAEARDEIERNFQQLAELRVEQVTDRERKRIAGDLHDDLGAKLLTIVHTSESERISTLAREALEEMRLSVRGLTGKPMQLMDALADWRAEVISRLGQARIEGRWNMPLEEMTHTLAARAFVQTTRILREAVSNVIKHSGASACEVECVISDTDFLLVVRDNGRGIPVETDHRLDRGHGMASMKHRAKQLQGQCLVESAPGFGTVIRLTVPLERTVLPA